MSVHQSTKDYVFECKVGRDAAARLISDVAREQVGMPVLVQKIREAATDQSGFGVGFLWAIGEGAVK